MKTPSPRLGWLALALLLPSTSFAQTLTAVEILQKSQDKYHSLTSYSAVGRVISAIQSAAPTNSLKAEDGFRLPLVATFEIKLGRPNLYRIEWEQKVHSAFSNKGAVWSAGDGDFLLIGEQRYSKMNSRETALAGATGISSGAANTIPAAFFADPHSPLKALTDFSLETDDKFDNDECYVVAGSQAGQKARLWISKETLLIRKRQQTLGGQRTPPPEMTDDTIKETLKQMNKEATPEAILEMREKMRSVYARVGQFKGTITELHEKIVINEPVPKEQFIHRLPEGLKPSTSLF